MKMFCTNCSYEKNDLLTAAPMNYCPTCGGSSWTSHPKLSHIYDESIVYYGPHLCDLGFGGCKALIVKSGNNYQPIIRLDALTEENNGPAYPNWRWKKHVCAADAAQEGEANGG